RSSGRSRPSILADTVEALIGAVYLDAGADVACEIVDRIVDPRLDTVPTIDHKSRLLEEIARRGLGSTHYDYTESGPEHAKTFTTIVHLDDVPLGQGAGRSKKQAEQAAAQKAWQALGTRSGLKPAEEDSHG